MNFTDDELNLLRDSLLTAQSRYMTAFGSIDGRIADLIAKMDTPEEAPADPVVEQSPAKKSKKA